ncbi:MAG: SDR family oxidoreductase [Phycisphaerales bacterium]|nr:SDR family oxidoreductase [Phycisphaerales bacterium]
MGTRHVGRVAVVTGASSGIGAASALAMADAGMDLVVSARRLDRLEAVVGQVERMGRSAVALVADAAEPGLAARLLDLAQTRFGKFDVVLANAGYGLDRPMHLMSDVELRTMFEVNFFSSTHLLQEAARRLISSKRPGHLLMTSSCLSKFSMPNFGAYAATKAAQESVCRAMRFELAPYRIEVASVHPVSTTTEFFSTSARLSGTREAPIHDHAPKWFIQPPERVAKAIMRCLERPRSEVWTSRIVQASSALFTLMPSVLDTALRREASRQRGRHLGRTPDSQ